MSRVDWSQFAFPIQDQASCGSCTAYGTNSAVEGVTKIKYGACPKLSEKDEFYCSGGTCDTGNTMANALNKALRGIATLECCPNGMMPSGQDSPCGAGRCSNWWSDGVKIASWKQLSGLEAVKAALNLGPIDVDFQVYQSFINYTGGVYHKLSSGDSLLGGHCVSLWGYDDDQGCFLMRNSWGTGWGETLWGSGQGERGWCRIAYSEINHFFQVIADGPVAPEVGTLIVSVKGENGAGIVGAVVESLTQPTGQSKLEGTTGDMGEVKFTSVYTGGYSLQASFGDLTPGSCTANVYTNATTNVTIKLLAPPGPEKGNIVVLTRNMSGVGISASVQGIALPPAQAPLSGTSGSDGTIGFPNVEVGDYTFQASKSGYVTNTGTGIVYADFTATITINLPASPTPSPCWKGNTSAAVATFLIMLFPFIPKLGLVIRMNKVPVGLHRRGRFFLFGNRIWYMNP